MLKKEKVKSILSKIGTVLETIFIIFIVLFCFISICQRILSKDHSFFGYRIFNIVTSSMKPDLDVGDIILVKEIDPKDIKRGDNITYQGMSSELAGKIITHQVKNYIEENGKRIFYTQGINSDTMDPAVYEEQIYGIVSYKFKGLSFINRIITSTFGFILCVVLPLAYIFFLEMKTIAIENKNAKEKEKEEEERRAEEERKAEELRRILEKAKEEAVAEVTPKKKKKKEKEKNFN